MQFNTFPKKDSAKGHRDALAGRLHQRSGGLHRHWSGEPRATNIWRLQGKAWKLQRISVLIDDPKSYPDKDNARTTLDARWREVTHKAQKASGVFV